MLEYEGWQASPLLPNGWRWREDKVVKSSKEFMDSLGNFHKSFRQAEAELKSSKQQLKNFRIFASQNQSEHAFKEKPENASRAVNQEWYLDPYLPSGWKARKVDKRTGMQFILSPDGARQFTSRSDALGMMILQEFSEDDLERMREGMVREGGWERTDLLPPGWLYRIISSGNQNKSGGNVHHRIISSEGIVFKSMKNAAEFMEKSFLSGDEKSYTDVDILKLTEFFDQKSAARRTELTEWIKNDNLPNGWKVRFSGRTGRFFYLSPTGNQFSGGRSTLQHMIENQYSKEDLEGMRNEMRKLGWERSEYLPEGWIISHRASDKRTNIRNHQIKVITREGKMLVSYSAVREFMGINQAYGQEDAEKLEKMLQDESNKRRISQNDWDDSKTLPAGWRQKISPSGKKFFLSPDGKHFAGIRLAYQHLIQNNYPEDGIALMRVLMDDDGWRVSEHLPTNWLFRQTRSKKSGTNLFLSSEGTLFRSFLAVIKFMEGSVDYSQEDSAKINNLLSEASKDFRKTAFVKADSDQNLPEGWKSRTCGTKLFFISPEGEQFGTKRLAYCNIVQRQNNYTEKDIAVMRSSMIDDGWGTSEHLPSNWLYKQTRGPNSQHSVNTTILSSEGDKLESFLAAVKYMEDRDYFPDNIANINNLVSELSKNHRKTDFIDVKTNTNLPGGWKGRVCGTKLFIISPVTNTIVTCLAFWIYL